MNAEEEMDESLEEGVHYLWEVTPFEYVSTDGKISAVKYWHNQMIIEGGGRAKPIPQKDKVEIIPCDTVIEATGQETDYSFMGDDYLRQLRLTPQGHVIVDRNGMTSIPKLFSGGDSTNSSKDLISAVRDADTAVMGILEHLNVMDQITDDKLLPVLDRWKKYSPSAGKRMG